MLFKARAGPARGRGRRSLAVPLRRQSLSASSLSQSLEVSSYDIVVTVP